MKKRELKRNTSGDMRRKEERKRNRYKKTGKKKNRYMNCKRKGRRTRKRNKLMTKQVIRKKGVQKI